MFRRFLAALLGAPLVLAAAAMAQDPGVDSSGLPPGVLLLSRIKRHVREQVTHLPDYTCLQTAQRYTRPAGPRGVFKLIEVQNLEVLNSGEKELYASPGATNFEHDDPGRFSNQGLSGTGLFALHVRTLFVDDNGVFQYRGVEDLAGRRAVRYDYKIGRLQSGFRIVLPEGSGIVATKGSFWADPVTLDLLRLDIEADDIPPDLPLASSISRIVYTYTRIGDRDVLLPERAEMILVETSGLESRNLVEFTHCRAYRAQSSVRFDGGAGAEEARANATGLPPGLTGSGLPDSVEPVELVTSGPQIAIALDAPLSSAEAVGTPIEARVAGNVEHKGKLLIPDGALVRGRVRRLERTPDGFVVALEFTEFENGQPFYGELQEVDAPAAFDRKRPAASDPPGVGTFSVSGDRFTLPKGFRTVWKTKAL